MSGGDDDLPPKPAPRAVEPDDATQFVPQTTPPATGLAADAEDRTWFAGAPPSQAPAQPVATSGGVQIGTLINNNYKVSEVLSAGGMGEVYKGENVYTNDPVAIKVILDKLASDAKATAMFMREAKTLSQLSDDAIVRYYNFVRDPGIDRFCLIMEFIEGVPLSDHMDKFGPVPVSATESLMQRIARGLEKAHRRGVIHRDLSPDNVMLPMGIISEARLIDFGIARSIVAEDRPVAEEFAGKFKFVAPEQLGHFGGTIGPQTDVYGLALMISAALRGSALEMGRSIEEAAQLRLTIPDLSDIPAQMRPLLSHMLEPDPDNRPTGMADVLRLLDEPADIPDQYFEGPKPKPKTAAPAIASLQTVPGLALPPTQMQADEDSALDDVVDIDGGGTGAIKIMATVAVLLIAGLGGFAYTQGFLTETELVAPDPIKPVDPVAALDALLTPRQPNSRDGFLAALDTGPCSYISRVTVGPMAGALAGYGVNGTFTSVPAAYEAQFGAGPAVQFRQVTAEQCTALSFARNLQGRAVQPASLELDQITVASSVPFNGQFVDLQGRAVWLALISPQGRVYPITDRLSVPLQGRQTFSLQLQLDDASPAVPQLFLAVVSEQPLISTAQIREGIEVDVLLPLILEEIAESGGQGTAALTHVMLQPPLPEAPVPSDPAPDETDP